MRLLAAWDIGKVLFSDTVKQRLKPACFLVQLGIDFKPLASILTRRRETGIEGQKNCKSRFWGFLAIFLQVIWYKGIFGDVS